MVKQTSANSGPMKRNQTGGNSKQRPAPGQVTGPSAKGGQSKGQSSKKQKVQNTRQGTPLKATQQIAQANQKPNQIKLPTVPPPSIPLSDIEMRIIDPVCQSQQEIAQLQFFTLRIKRVLHSHLFACHHFACLEGPPDPKK